MTTEIVRIARKARILAACAGLFLLAGMASAGTINVPGDYATIQAAINAAGAGDEIVVAAGTYMEGAVLTINKSDIKIFGPNRDIDPNTSARVPEAIIQTTGAVGTYNINIPQIAVGVYVSDVEINGLTIDGRTVNGGISYYRTTNLTIAYNRIIDIANGIQSSGALNGLPANTLITHNLIYNVFGSSRTALMITGGAYEAGHGLWTVSYNVIDRVNYAGFQPQGGMGTRIIGNLVQNVTRHGVNLYQERDIQIIGNIFRNVNIRPQDCDTGAIRFYAPSSGSTQSCRGPFIIENNLIDGCNNGIHIRSCSSSMPFPPACGTGACSTTWVASDNPSSPILIQNNTIVNFRGYAFNYSLPAPGAPPIANVIDGNYVDPGTIDGQYGGADFHPNDNVSTPVVTNDQPTPPDFMADTDGDGLKNWEETSIYGTNPLVPDTDTGGTPDGAEVVAGTDPLAPGDDVPLVPPADGNDADGDGFTNGYEYQVGTDPNSAASKPMLGDVNDNSVIDNVDAAIVQNISLGNIPASNYQAQRLDVNGDGKIDVIDAALLFDFFLDNIAILR